MKKLFKLTAVFLSAIIIVQSFVTVAFAAESPQAPTISSASQTIDEPTMGNPDLPEMKESTLSDAQIVTECNEKRTENTKTFLMSDGTFLKAVYNEPVHYKDDAGVWQDIDNTLSVTNTNTLVDTQKLQNKARRSKIKLSPRTKSSKTVSLKAGDYSISWGLDSASTAKSEVVSKQAISSTESHNDQFLKLRKLNNEILYKDALPGIDVQYLISSSTVKENIILKTKDAQKQFTETYDIGNLEAKQKNDRTIELFGKSDTKRGKPVYTISAPQMIDANGESSDAISMSIVQHDKGTLKLAIHTDETWLSDKSRTYPVTVDPTVFTKRDSSAIHDTFISSGTKYHDAAGLNNAMGTMYIGNETANYDLCRILINFTLPNFSKGDMIVGAQLNLAQRSDGLNPSSTSMQINAYAMNSDWNETKVTWDNSFTAVNEAINGSVLDYFNVSQTTANTFNTWDITKLAKDWYSGTKSNCGIVLKAEDETAVVRNVYYASNYPDGQDVYPTIAIRFVNNAGLEGYWSYHSQLAGRAGTGAVNDYTGNLVYSVPIMNTTGERAPLDFSIFYNGYRTSTHFKDNQRGLLYGWGWQGNLSQRVDPIDEDSGTNANEKAKFKLLHENGYRYVYLDEDGTEHYFIADPNDPAKVIDEDGLGLEITSCGTSDEYYTIKYSDGSNKTFTSSGYLRKIYDSENNSLSLSYEGSFLNRITDGAGRDTTIAYSQYGSITSITGPDGKQTQFHYYGGHLTSITYPDNKAIQFTYDANNQLQKAVNVDGTYVQYSYYSSDNPMVLNRVQNTAEYSVTGAVGNKVVFTYNNDNSTTFQYLKFGQTADQAQKEAYNFDNLGRTVNVLNADNSAATYAYSDPSTKDATANKMVAQTATNDPVINLLLDHNAERDNGTWTNSDSKTGSQFSVDSTVAYLGTKSLKVTNNSTYRRSGAVQTVSNLIAGTVYTLSGYAKTSSFGRGSQAQLYVQVSNGSTHPYTPYITSVSKDSDWQRISVTFTVPANTTSVKVYAVIYGIGTAWFDCMQLETGSVANTYNMLENGDFRYNKDYQPLAWNSTNFTLGDGMSGGWLRIGGNPTLNKNLYQEVYINKPASSVAFSVSGKSQATSVPTRRDGRYYAIDLGMYFTDGTSQFDIVDFNPDTTTQQYASSAIAPSEANKDKTVSKIIYHIIYYKNVNEALFKNLQLNMDETGTAYSYDSNGKLVSSKQNAKNKEEYTFTDAKELASAKNKNNENYAYTYDTENKHEHRLTAAKSKQTGTGLAFGYGNYGNVINTKMGTITTDGKLSLDDPYLESTQDYNASGNYLTSSSDQRGKTTTYNIDSTTGLTNSVTDPKGNTTNYTYNPQNQLLTGVKAKSSAGTVENTYDYDTADQLSKITHNGFDYTFKRDGFGNTTMINVGAQNLMSNMFASGNGNLLSSTYGNGLKLGYGYDAYDRLTSAAKDGETAYIYTYDARGNLASITDKTVESRDQSSGGFSWIQSSLSSRYSDASQIKKATSDNTSRTGIKTEFFYDIGDRLIKKSDSENSAIQYAYDNMNRATTLTYHYAYQTKKTTFEYGPDNRKEKTTLATNGTITREYDSLNREYITNINAANGQDPTLRTQRSFVNVSGNKTTTLVDTYSNYKRIGNTNTTLSQYHYTYDDNGNILTTTDKDGNITTYTYDSLNQLVRADDKKANVSTTYSYDVGGNIIDIKTYAYTTGTLENSANSVAYTYGNTNWKDLLTSYNGQNITYDAIGNPLSYRDGMNFTWEGRQLKTSVANGKNVSYTYNNDGIRTRKTVNKMTTYYFLDGSTLLYQEDPWGENRVWFLYDSDGTRVGFTYNGTTYYYTTNAQGDVTGIVDSNANTVVEYTYDAWGKLLSTTGSKAGSIGKLNPFLYRGYYYDTETGLYYLNSRYYDPQTGRFINADDTSTLQAFQGDLLSTNLFAYCENNPIIYSDPNGDVLQFAAAGAYGAYTAIAAEAGAANFWNPVGWTILGFTAVATVAIIGYSYYQSQQKPKPVNLPSYKTIKLDMEHILSGHGPNGSRGGPNKDRFPNWMTASSIATAIRTAYRYAESLQRQGDRVFVQGPWNGYSIQMWVNTAKKIIESAWPKY